ncbi:hypothetical protein [Candidatus Synechococcus spongiarum]|uniref:Uncharacterized protein n=1 Tax=Candidatus Synechococcus spongiarum LMB bulk15N TaxID=1943583 RepID=A0A1T1D2P0_9SYNE|nr:hypothetical protein [Candidatus Synechococcus spongiarum]OOV35018.1 hypothetical protein BV53_04675 [Candidatus Synechococcus spongiarum LMB bulk15N]
MQLQPSYGTGSVALEGVPPSEPTSNWKASPAPVRHNSSHHITLGIALTAAAWNVECSGSSEGSSTSSLNENVQLTFSRQL